MLSFQTSFHLLLDCHLGAELLLQRQIELRKVAGMTVGVPGIRRLHTNGLPHLAPAAWVPFQANSLQWPLNVKWAFSFHPIELHFIGNEMLP